MIAEQDPPPAFLAATHEVLIARAEINRYGVQGWMLLYDVKPSEVLPEALSIIDGELSRLEREKVAAKAAPTKRHGRQ